MAANSNRQKVIRQNIGGGTSAPAGAAKGPTTGIGGNKQNPLGYWGQNKPWGPRSQEYGGGGYIKAGLSTPPQPGASGPTQPQPNMPWDIAAANDEAEAGKRLGNALTGLDTGWLGAEQEFGVGQGFNDYASNPYSRAALLQRSYDNAKRGSLNSAGQQLYAGAYINAQNTNTHDFSMGRDELEKSRGRAYADYQSNRQHAQDEYNQALSNAAWNRVNAGLEEEPEPAPYGGGSSPAPNASGGNAKATKKNPIAAKAFGAAIKKAKKK